MRRFFGVEEVVGKDGTKIDVEVNAEEREIEQELRLAEPLLWESEFPPEAERKGMMKEMNSMKDFDVYDEVLVKGCTDEQVNEAVDCRRVKVWKNETDLRCRVVVRGCFQNVEKNNLFASTPSLVTMRLLLCMAMPRNWGIGRCEHCLLACSNVWRRVRLVTKGVLSEWRLSLEIEDCYVWIETGPKTVERAFR